MSKVATPLKVRMVQAGLRLGNVAKAAGLLDSTASMALNGKRKGEAAKRHLKMLEAVISRVERKQLQVRK